MRLAHRGSTRGTATSFPLLRSLGFALRRRKKDALADFSLEGGRGEKRKGDKRALYGILAAADGENFNEQDAAAAADESTLTSLLSGGA